MRHSRRFHILLPADLEADLRAFARQRGLGLAAALRLLAAQSMLEEGSLSTGACGDRAAALATLTAAEHAVLMVASVLPEGQRRRRELAAEAALAAEERLASFKEPHLD